MSFTYRTTSGVAYADFVVLFGQRCPTILIKNKARGRVSAVSLVGSWPFFAKLRSQSAHLRPTVVIVSCADIVSCGRRPKHFFSHKEAICGPRQQKTFAAAYDIYLSMSEKVLYGKI